RCCPHRSAAGGETHLGLLADRARAVGRAAPPVPPRRMTELGYRIARPFLNLLTPEAGHRLALRALKTGFLRAPPRRDDPVLKSRIWGLDFPNPIGLAAGFAMD